MSRRWATAIVTLLGACSSTSVASNPRGVASTDATAEVTSAPTPDQIGCVAGLPLAVRVGQLVWPAVTGDELRSRAADVRRWGVGGVVLMTWTARSTAADLQALKSASPIPLLVATDEEGGSVQRLGDVGVLPSARTMAKQRTPAEAGDVIAAHARALRDLGIDVVYAPVVDVSPITGSGPIGSRAFSRDPAVVTAFARAYVEAWESAGILPVLKHFPGHGSASADSHEASAVTPPLDQLRRRDLLPYTDLAGSGAAVMVGHLSVPGLTEPKTPASLSPAAITGLLRTELGYATALVFTDALGMDAITDGHTIAQAAVLAIIAGADVAIFTNTDQTDAVLAALQAAVVAGQLTDARLNEAVAHVLRAKQVDPCSIGSVRSSAPG